MLVSKYTSKEVNCYSINQGIKQVSNYVSK